MKQFVLLCVVALLAPARCSKAAYEMEEEKDPAVMSSVKLMVPEKFEILVSGKQYFTRDGGSEDPRISIRAWSLGADLNMTKFYFSPVNSNCSDWVASEMDKDMSEKVTMMLKNASRDAEGKWMQVEGANAFEGIRKNLKFIVVQDGVNYCENIEIEMEGIPMLPLKYDECKEFDGEALTKIVCKRLGLEEGQVQLGASGMNEGCSWVNIYFIAEFDVKTLKMALSTFKSTYELGRYSPSEMCMTDLKDTFIVKKIVNMFMAKVGEKKEEMDREPVKTCAGISTKLAKEYKARLSKWDCMTKSYLKKYGESFEGCQAAGQMDQCDCTKYLTADAKKYMQLKVIADYIGLPLELPELKKNRMALTALLSQANPDSSKLEMLGEEFEKLQKKQNQLVWDAHRGSCLAAAHKKAALDTVKGVKMAFLKYGLDAGPYILRDLLKNDLKYRIEYVMENGTSDEEWEAGARTMKQKLEMIFRFSTGCSTANDRKESYAGMMEFAKAMPKLLKGMSALIDNRNISMALNETRDSILEDPSKLANAMFFILYAPAMEPKEDDEMMKKFEMLQMALKENSKLIWTKLKEYSEMEDADIDLLWIARVMMTSEKEFTEAGGCDYSMLAEKIKSMEQKEWQSQDREGMMEENEEW